MRGLYHTWHKNPIRFVLSEIKAPLARFLLESALLVRLKSIEEALDFFAWFI